MASSEEVSDKELAAFKSRIDAFVKPAQPDAYGFIEFLVSKEMDKHIKTLKWKATKKKPFNFERVTLVLLPLFKYFESSKVG